MIDAGPSLEAAKIVTSAGLLSYLVAKGWTARPSRVEGVSILSKEVSGTDRPVEFILPIRPGWEEEQRRVADALRTLQAVERRSLAEIVHDVLPITAREAMVAIGGAKAGFAETPSDPEQQGGTLPEREILAMVKMLDYLITEVGKIDVTSAECLVLARKSLDDLRTVSASGPNARASSK